MWARTLRQENAREREVCSNPLYLSHKREDNFPIATLIIIAPSSHVAGTFDAPSYELQ